MGAAVASGENAGRQGQQGRAGSSLTCSLMRWFVRTQLVPWTSRHPCRLWAINAAPAAPPLEPQHTNAQLADEKQRMDVLLARQYNLISCLLEQGSKAGGRAAAERIRLARLGQAAQDTPDTALGGCCGQGGRGARLRPRAV